MNARRSRGLVGKSCLGFTGQCLIASLVRGRLVVARLLEESFLVELNLINTQEK
ncbi:MAG: hypothetical protein H8E42_00515 [Nitrospinae bacterium]|nr:hypothetical protein [Nitrospinota bacterium]MBL7021285.1 hypothetical protein [Nitrospinaceae bacterium]